MPAEPTIRKRARPLAKRGSGRPPASDGEATRARIMTAAQDCFARAGYRETSNRNIADAAGVTAGTIYHYFVNKRELFLTVHEDIQKQIRARVREPTRAATTFIEAVRTFVDTSAALHQAFPSVGRFNAVVRTEALRNPEIADARFDQEWRQFYHALSDLGVATGEIDRADAPRVRRVLAAVVLGLTQHGVEATPSDHAECLRGVVALFEGALVRRASERRRA
ncbi:MAG TPA: TetR/AcrR family transcriptional regulator [Nevskiaceae bacterium]|nr:TetR/AcrR family transcriptional regulator [Nevskiaceae bacterium]